MTTEIININEQLYKDTKNSSLAINQNNAIDNIQLKKLEIIEAQTI